MEELTQLRNKIDELIGKVEALSEAKVRFMKTKEASEMFPISSQTLRDNKDEIGYILNGKNLIFRDIDIIKFLNKYVRRNS